MYRSGPRPILQVKLLQILSRLCRVISQQQLVSSKSEFVKKRHNVSERPAEYEMLGGAGR